MSSLLLDTSAYRAFKRTHSRIQSSIETADGIFFNPMVLGELYSGYAKGGSIERDRQELEGFLADGNIEILPVDAETSKRYAYLFTYLRKAGTPVSPNDLWIAATAMQHGLIVITTDRDFLRIPQILVDFHEPLG